MQPRKVVVTREPYKQLNDTRVLVAREVTPLPLHLHHHTILPAIEHFDHGVGEQANHHPGEEAKREKAVDVAAAHLARQGLEGGKYGALRGKVGSTDS